jgi:phosphotransferase system HPr-like phosphotransfer protein
MTEDDISRGLTRNNIFTGKAFDAVSSPAHIESVIAVLPTGAEGNDELWKLNHYYERLDEWNEAHHIQKKRSARPPAESIFEVHNLSVDPEERTNLSTSAPEALSQLRTVLEIQRDAKRRLPSHRNPT